MTRRLVILIVLVLAAAGAGFGAWRAGWVTKAGGDGPLILSGNVDIRQVDLGFRVPGRIAEILIEEGARASAGQILAKLDAAPYEAAAAAARAQVDVDSAQLDKLKHGNRPQEIAQAEGNLQDAEAALALAQIQYQRAADLLASRTGSQANYDTAEQVLRSAQAKLDNARQALSLEREGARQEDIAAAAAALALAKAQREKADTDLADAVMRAPNDGVILIRAQEPGATVAAGGTVLTLTIDRPMRVRGYVDEPDLHRLSPGMAALVTTDGNPKIYHGSIGYIAPTAEFTPKTVQTPALRADLVYRLRVIVDDPDDGLRQGAPVTIRLPDARSGGG
jgi:HlyD family secretion protein